MLDAIAQEKRIDFVDKQLNQKRQVKLKTCADVYEHWRAYKRTYKKAPSDGVEFQIDYIDTGLALGEDERSRAPIALALHGAPGSYHDFSLLINHLARQRVRVIAPNFPEYVATVKTKVLFRHSADEKAAYLRDFLKAINVRRIDLLVSHSSAIFPTLLILLNANSQAVAGHEQRRAGDESGARAKTQRRRAREPAADGATGAEAEAEADAEADAETTPALALESLSELGGKLRAEMAQLVVGAGAQQAERAPAAAGRDDERDDDEVFQDASDELDSNNNNNNNNNNKIKLPPPGRADDERRRGAGRRHEREPGQRGRKQAKRPTRAGAEHAPIVKFDEPIEVRAVALFNPAGHRLPKSMKPTWFKCGSVHVYQHKLGRSLFRKFGPAFLTVVGVPVRVDNMDNVMLSATVMRNSKCQRVVRQLEQLSQMKIPTLLVFSENDKLIEKDIFYEMTQFMKLDPKHFDVFNNDGDIELSRSLTEDWIRVMVFKAGGHYAYSNYAKTVNKAVSELLARVTTAAPSKD